MYKYKTHNWSDHVDAKWEDGHYYWAKIDKINPNGTYGVQFDDGEYDAELAYESIREKTGLFH